MPILPFNGQDCTKCRSAETSLQFCRPLAPCGSGNDGWFTLEDHLHVTCERCGWEWLEYPADAEGVAHD